jgi:N-acetylmuramic acid 6-phosphate etherase
MKPESKWHKLPTEAINRRTLNIDTMPIDRIVTQINREDRRAVAAVAKVRPQITAAVRLIVASLAEGGRVLFVGAGTSGRLGVLEAAEVPPTFGTPHTLVRAVIAGGEGSVFRAREGAEDDYADGVRQMRRVKLSKRDVVIGVSASGVTEFVRGALTRARRVRARRVLVTCRPGTDRTLADVTIAPEVGPEVIAGSTRMKAGTATKLVLNMLTTIPMVRIGKTYGNLMVDVRTGSAKLKDRATRMVSMVTGLARPEAAALLGRAHWNVKAAIVMARNGGSAARARKRLRESGDSMRATLGEDLASVLRRQKKTS